MRLDQVMSNFLTLSNKQQIVTLCFKHAKYLWRIMLQFGFMKQKPKLNHVYFMYISLQSHYAEANMKQVKKPMKPMKQTVSSISTGFLLLSNEPIKIF